MKEHLTEEQHLFKAVEHIRKSLESQNRIILSGRSTRNDKKVAEEINQKLNGVIQKILAVHTNYYE